MKPVSSAHPPVPSEQWDDVAQMFEPLAPVSNSPTLPKHDVSEELIVETSFAEPSGTSASAVFAHNEGKQADPTHDEMTSDSGLFAKKLVKRPPPDRVNPEPDTFFRKKKDTHKKFEEMLAKGFETFTEFVKKPAAESSAAKIPEKKSANASLMEYLLMELEELPVEKQSIMRRSLLEFFMKEKEVLQQWEE